MSRSKAGSFGEGAIGRPRISADVLAKAAAECEVAEGRFFQAGKLVWKNANEVALKHGIGRSTLRRYLREHMEELRAQKAPKVLDQKEEMPPSLLRAVEEAELLLVQAALQKIRRRVAV